jgi:uncharacterized protein
LVAEVLHGAPCRFSDPARFSLAHGGKDRHPFPVPIKVYDETLRVLRCAVDKARLGQDDMLFALQKLRVESRRLERVANGPAFDDFISDEFVRSHDGGRSVFGWEPPWRVAASAPARRRESESTRPFQRGQQSTCQEAAESPDAISAGSKT